MSIFEAIKNYNKQNTELYSTDTIGKGVRSKNDITVYNVPIIFHGDIVPSVHVKDFDMALQIGYDEFIIASEDIDDFVNHSCDPNTVLVKTFMGNIGFRWCLRVIKDIKKGEPITFDYSGTMSGKFWKMDCKCGSDNCRKNIGDLMDLPPSKIIELKNIQQKYSMYME